MEIVIIAAMTTVRGIGYRGGLPWSKEVAREDMARFKQLTTGHPIIIGHNTWQSIGATALPNRLNIVISNRHDDQPIENVVYVPDLNRALKEASQTGDETVFIIGGGEIYKQAIHIANRLELTIIPGVYPHDTVFPIVWPDVWECRKITVVENIQFCTYLRKQTKWDPSF